MKNGRPPFACLQAGLQIAVSVFIGFYLGYRLDKKFDTSPILMLTGCAIGIFAGFYLFFKDIFGKDK